jgi:HSP20 family molecular chaperone IbpA
MLKVKNKSNFDLIDSDFLVNPFSDGFSEDILKSSIKQGDKSYIIKVNVNNIPEEDIDIKIENDNLIVTVFNKSSALESKRQKNFYIGKIKLKDIKKDFNDGVLTFEVPIK